MVSFGFSGIMLLLSALVLLANAMKGVPVVGDTLSSLGKWLAGFSVLIGILDIIAWVL